jgi:hypothetical protein
MRRILMLSAGGLLLVAGIALLVLPGPGLPLIAIGLGLLASEVPMVRQWVTTLIAKLPLSEEKKQKLRRFAERQRHAH